MWATSPRLGPLLTLALALFPATTAFSLLPSTLISPRSLPQGSWSSRARMSPLHLLPSSRRPRFDVTGWKGARATRAAAEAGGVNEDIARLEALLAGGEDKKFTDAMRKVEKGGGKAPTRLLKALKKASGAFCSVVELRREGGEGDAAVEELSRECRVNKATAVLVDSGAAGAPRDLARVCAEQESARGNFPGPVPVIRRFPSTLLPLQAAEAASVGAKAVAIPGASFVAEAEAMGLLCAACAALDLEMVAEVSDGAEIDAAFEAGVRVFCIRGVADLDEALALRARVPAACAAIAAIPAQQEESNELEEARAVKAGGFDGVLLIEAALDPAQDTGYVAWVLGALQSKKSATFNFGAMGTSGEITNNGQNGGIGSVPQEAARRDPKGWAKAQKEAKSIVADYKKGNRPLGKTN